VDNRLPGATENYSRGGSIDGAGLGNEKGATPFSMSVASESIAKNYSLRFPAFLAFSHLAFAAAEIAALPAARIFLLGFCSGVADAVVPLIFAHLAF
jgi:hypothetical protein